jgi:hypothetical protein
MILPTPFPLFVFQNLPRADPHLIQVIGQIALRRHIQATITSINPQHHTGQAKDRTILYWHNQADAAREWKGNNVKPAVYYTTHPREEH